MSPRSFRRTLGLSAAVLAATAGAGWAAIEVDVNGRAVKFGAVQPARLGGRVFIPLRAVVESLGADIKWDAPTQTVRGSKGEREFSLRIGSRDATVNGSPVKLDVPAQLISGTTMVPLRFVAEALGAEVEWNAADQRVAIQSAEDTSQPVAGRVEGDVVAVRAEGRPPTLTVRANGVRSTYEVTRDTIVLRGPEGERGRQAGLDEIEVGERVRLRVSPEGALEVVEAFTADEPRPGQEKAVTGEVVAIRMRGNSRTVTLKTPTGRVLYTVPDDTVISRIIGNQRPVRGAFDDLRVGDQVSVVPDARGETLRSLEVRVAEAPLDNTRVTGEVVAIRADSRPPTLTVRSGNNRVRYDVAEDAIIFRKVGQGRAVRARLDELQTGDEVTLRLDPKGEVARVIDALGEDAAAPLPEPAKDLRITSFTHSGKGSLAGGSRLEVTLVGTPGGTAFVDIGSVAKNVPLQEDRQRPGRYIGAFTVPKGVTAKDVAIIGQLKSGNRTAPLVQSAATLDIDSEAPKISDVAPDDKAQTTNATPDIYAEISDAAGTGIDEESLKVTVRGQDVTRLVKVTPRFLLYTPSKPLTPGAVPVTISVRDRAGNETQSTWTFNVRPASDAVQSVTHNATEPLKVGDVLTVTVKAQPRSRATFSVGDLVKSRELRETSSGNYVGRYIVQEGDEVVKAPVIVEVITPNGDRVKQEGTAPVNILTRDPEVPQILSPEPEKPFRLGNELVVAGRGTPGSKIVVEVSYMGKAFGALPVRGTFGSQEVTVDKNGRWETEPFAVRLSLGVRRPDLTVRAVTIDAAGRESKPKELNLQTR